MSAVYSNAEICAAFFDNDSKCRCNKVVVQAKNSGYGNLITHVTRNHKDEIDKVTKSHKEKGMMHAFLPSEKCKNIYSWLEWGVMDSMPFSFVESEYVIKNSKLKSISTETYMKYIGKLTVVVQNKVFLIILFSK